MRLSVYCLGEVVKCQSLLARLVRGKLRRPGEWVDALWENALHSYQEVEHPEADAEMPHIREEYLGDLEASEEEAMPHSRKEYLGDMDASEEEAAPRQKEHANPEHHEWHEFDEHERQRASMAAPSRVRRTRHVFVFGFGCVVFWGLAKNEERDVVRAILDEPAIVLGVTSAAERVEAHDTMTYKVDPETREMCRNDVVRLSTDDPLEKFSLSFALAQSAKLFVWEARVDVTINEVKHIPERLANTGKTELTEKQISKMIGKVFIERTQVNLHSEILDTPDFLWEEDAFEPGYIDLRDHLDVPERVELLNNRLDILNELLDVLNTQLANHHSSRLEIIVIWLIIAEILVTLFTFIMDRLLPRGYSQR